MTRPCASSSASAATRLPALSLLIALAIAIAWTPRPAHAQTGPDTSATSYLTPFPGGERYKIRVIGDEYGEGMNEAIVEALSSDPRVEVEKKPGWLSGMTRPDSEAEIKNLAAALAREKPHIVVIMLGSMDRWSYRTPDGRRHHVGTPEWRTVYARRIDEVIRTFKTAGVSIYWVGLPIMRRAESNEAAQVQNEVFRERTYLAGVRYVDIYQSFADEQGEYNAYGPDLAGKSRLLRDADGMHMTDAGYQKLAHFVERELKRDLNQAKNERAIPLAGSEAEQALVNPAKSAAKPGAAGGSWSTSSTAPAGGQSAAAGDQAAETSQINLKTMTDNGREQVLPIDIVRPAIPAAVIALVTRRESPDKASPMGDQVLDQIPGGLTVMSSITPGGDTSGAARRKLSPAQTPYFRVLVKGERIAARPGRADDTSWPRPEPDPPQPATEIVPNAAEPKAAVPLPASKPRR